MMKTGMLWFDDDLRSDVQAKIERAADYYRKKYGVKPDLCFVHPSMMNGAERVGQNGIEVRTTKLILPHHMWLGRAEA